MLAEKVCKRCMKKTTEDGEWWKCCPEHTTEQGPDVVCKSCKNELHPICCALNAENFGIQELCGYDLGHAGRHTWETYSPPLDDPVEEAPEVPSYVEKYMLKPKEDDDGSTDLSEASDKG